MKFQKQNTPKQDFLDSGSVVPCCPLLNIPGIDEHGMVMEMRCGFEVGSTIALGFHLQSGAVPPPSGQGKPKPFDLSKPGHAGSVFISVEVIVVESKIGSNAMGQPTYLVTVLFSQISRKAREGLLHYSGNACAHPGRQAAAGPTDASAPLDHSEKFLREVTQRIYLN